MTNEKPEVEVKTPEFTREELGVISQLVAQATVKVIDAPPVIALVNKIADMIEAMDDQEK